MPVSDLLLLPMGQPWVGLEQIFQASYQHTLARMMPSNKETETGNTAKITSLETIGAFQYQTIYQNASLA